MKIAISHALAAISYIAENYQDGPVISARMSKKYGIPLAYLLRVLQHLVKAQILISKKGPRGGYYLARDPKEISMLQIIEAVNGPMMRDQHIAELVDNIDILLKLESICKKATEKEMEIYDKAKLSDMLK